MFVKLCRAVAFADDTVIIGEAYTWEKVEENVESALEDIYVWLVTNTLKLSISKTKFITFGNNRFLFCFP